MYQDVPAELACTLYFGAQVDHVREGPIRIEWTGSRRFEVRAGDGDLVWVLELESTPVTGVFNGVSSLLPLVPGTPVLCLRSCLGSPAWRCGPAGFVWWA